jgi:hypothetical protein
MKRLLILTTLTLTTAMVAVSPAQTPRLVNARQTTRSAAAGLAGVVDDIVRGTDAVAWVGYSVPAVADRGSNCCDSCRSGDDGCCGGHALEEGSHQVKTGPVSTMGSLEATASNDPQMLTLMAAAHMGREIRIPEDLIVRASTAPRCRSRGISASTRSSLRSRLCSEKISPAARFRG